ncbi:MAG: hypothetical protein IT561_17125 [Alphaproteobacteria bacterium]|nr:hypothetical protein [Alphaproteobacteria bacterium]
MSRTPSDDADRAAARNALARALSRWENEGGAIPPTPPVLDQEEEHILECLGAAVVALWDALPREIQKAVFEHAISADDPRHAPDAKARIARFLHDHKGDDAA